MRTTGSRLFLLVVGSGLAMTSSANAQSIITGGTADANNRAAGARAPGNMVTTGVARAQDAATAARGSGRITDIPSTSLGTLATFRVDAVQTISNQLLAFALFFGNRLLERAGFPSIVPDVSSLIPSLNTGGNGGSDATTNPRDTAGGGTGTTGTGNTGRNPRRKTRR